ncbi:hypothetical protein [Streptomyces sp. NPDC048191]|uniref:hypothetical protein n=1 Tax=Streptomyces sp. NPDC048191 TaxID=3155484 RepID=UPI0033E6347A
MTTRIVRAFKAMLEGCDRFGYYLQVPPLAGPPPGRAAHTAAGGQTPHGPATGRPVS